VLKLWLQPCLESKAIDRGLCSLADACAGYGAGKELDKPWFWLGPVVLFVLKRLSEFLLTGAQRILLTHCNLTASGASCKTRPSLVTS
jgi:hypothetical protein